MIRVRCSLLATVALPVTLILSSPAAAQDYNTNCDPPTAEEKLTIDSWTESGLRIKALDRLMTNVCKKKHALLRLLKMEPDPDKITNEMVLEAARPNVDPVLARMQAARDRNSAVEKLKMRAERAEYERRNSNPAEEAARAHAEEMERNRGYEPVPLTPAAAGERPPAPEPIVLPPTRKGGFINIFEGKQTPVSGTTTLNGTGTLITDDGIQSGTFKNNQLQGNGEEVTADGTLRIGTFDNGEMEGDGVEVREEGGKVALVEGVFKDDKPEGVVTVTYDNGSSRRDIWYQGERAATGTLAAAGKTPTTPVFKTPEQLAEEAAAKFETLLKTGSATALYAMADGLQAKGATDTAKRAYQAIVSRFPASPLAATAIAQLARQEANERAQAEMVQRRADAARQAELARKQEAARQAQIAQMQYQQQLEAQRRAEAYEQQRLAAEEQRRRQEEQAAMGQFVNALGQALGVVGGSSVGGGTVPPTQSKKNECVYSDGTRRNVPWCPGYQR